MRMKEFAEQVDEVEKLIKEKDYRKYELAQALGVSTSVAMNLVDSATYRKGSQIMIYDIKSKSKTYEVFSWVDRYIKEHPEDC